MENVDLQSKIRSNSHFGGLVGESEGGPMLKVAALDATRTGTEAEDLANKLRRRVVGQDEAIQEYREDVPGLPRWTVPGWPADRHFPLSRSDRLRQNKARGGDGREFAWGSARGNQDRLRRVPA